MLYKNLINNVLLLSFLNDITTSAFPALPIKINNETNELYIKSTGLS